jgi:hypothetical protein
VIRFEGPPTVDDGIADLESRLARFEVAGAVDPTIASLLAAWLAAARAAPTPDLAAARLSRFMELVERFESSGAVSPGAATALLDGARETRQRIRRAAACG